MFICQPKHPPSSFPRRLPEYLQEQQQQQQQQRPSSATVFLERLETNANNAAIEEVASILARSFAGNHERSGEALFDWAIGSDFPRDDPTHEAKRIEYVGFYMKFNLLLSLEYGLVLIARDTSRTGKVLGAVVSFPPGTDSVTTTFGWHILRICFRMGHGPSEVLGKEAIQQMNNVGEIVKRVHNPAQAASRASNPSGTPPWYINILATDVDAQGKGCGMVLLNCIHYLADCDAADTMLEYDGERKEGYYCGKFGYKNTGEPATLSDPTKEKDDLAVTLTAAIRCPRQPRLPTNKNISNNNNTRKEKVKVQCMSTVS